MSALGFLPSQLRSHWTFNGANGLISVPVSGQYISNSGEVMVAASKAGIGLIVQPLELVKSDLESGKLVVLLPEYPILRCPCICCIHLTGV